MWKIYNRTSIKTYSYIRNRDIILKRSADMGTLDHDKRIPVYWASREDADARD